mgnify:CR=1 FL=1
MKRTKESYEKDLRIYLNRKFSLSDAIQIIKSMTMRYHIEKFKSIDKNKVSYVEIYDEISNDINAKNNVIKGLKDIMNSVEIDISTTKDKIGE